VARLIQIYSIMSRQLSWGLPFFCDSHLRRVDNHIAAAAFVHSCQDTYLIEARIRWRSMSNPANVWSAPNRSRTGKSIHSRHATIVVPSRSRQADHHQSR
jgi:hypothetical protein